MGKQVLVLSAGIGNVASVCKALERVGAEPTLSPRPEDVLRAERVVFPGQGAFSVMKSMRAQGLADALLTFIASGRPYFGICLGLQLLFQHGEECPDVPGLGLLRGQVERLPRSAGKIPHIGWNDIAVIKPDPLLEGIAGGTDFYFAHSYAVVPEDRAMVTLTCEYGGHFVAAIRSNNLFACQFHPEKSQAAGLKLLENFLRS